MYQTKRAALAETAAKHISASRISPRRWAYYADEVSAWFVCSFSEMVELGELLAAEDDDAYSHWCQTMPGREMPRGWSC